MLLLRLRKPRTVLRRCSRRAVDDLVGPLLAWSVEVGQQVLGPSVQRAAEGDDLGQRGRDVARDDLEHGSELQLRGGAIRAEVSPEDPPDETPG